MRRLYEIKSREFGGADWYEAQADDAHDIAVCQRGGNGRRFVGVFSLKAESGDAAVPVPDGTYENLIDGREVKVEGGKLAIDGRPVIFRAE